MRTTVIHTRTTACILPRVARSKTRTPTLQVHKRGQFFTKWGDRFHYFGTDEKTAQEKYAASLQEWALWKADKTEHKARVRSRLTFAELVKLFLAARLPDVSEDMAVYYDHHLRRGIQSFGRLPAATITGKYLQAYLVGLRTTISDRTKKALGAKTIRHDIAAIKAVLNWGMDMEHIPEVRLSAVKPPRLPPKKKKAYTIEFIKGLIGKCRTAHDEQLECWIAVNYLAGCRPSELPRLAARDGEFIHQGKDGAIYEIVGKMTWKTGDLRHVYLSPEAMLYFNALKPEWKDWRDYSKRVSALAPMSGGAHPLRHSAYSHLRAAGVPEEEIARFVGHGRGVVARSYDPTATPLPLRSAARLTLR
jgi:integrase